MIVSEAELYRVVSSEELYSGKLRGIRQLVETKDGRRFAHETIEHPGAVVVLPIDDTGRIVCVSQYRHSVGRVVLELPAGTLELGEQPVVCAQREIQEEIGLGAGQLKPLGTLYPAPGFCTEIQHLFVASDLYEKPAECDEDEDITVVRLTVQAFEAAARDGTMQDAKSMALFLRARLEQLV
jgi:ADP-ribose pyrophosphatase